VKSRKKKKKGGRRIAGFENIVARFGHSSAIGDQAQGPAVTARVQEWFWCGRQIFIKGKAG
jgi:hypothetical protein